MGTKEQKELSAAEKKMKLLNAVTENKKQLNASHFILQVTLSDILNRRSVMFDVP